MDQICFVIRQKVGVEDVFGGEDKDGNDKVKVETELISASLVDYLKKGVWLLKWSVTRF